MPTRATAIAEIAAREFGINDLRTTLNDRRDFYELAVWNIKAALEAAYEAGQKSLANHQSTL